MAGSSPELEEWRLFFERSNSDIFEVIERAITVAASDNPEEFLRRRDRLAEVIFTQRPRHGEEVHVAGEEGEGKRKRECENENVDTEQSKGSHDAAAKPNDEIEEKQMVGEILRIKEVLQNHQEQSDDVLSKLLRQLQLMPLTFEMLRGTEIGKSVSGLKRHSSKKIRQFVRKLIKEWKAMVDQWLVSNAASTDGTPNSIIAYVEEDVEMLQFPPVDEGALLATQSASFELSNFFDGMDEDGNLQTTEQQHDKNDSRGPAPECHNTKMKQQPSSISMLIEPMAQPTIGEARTRNTMPETKLLSFAIDYETSNPAPQRRDDSNVRTQQQQQPAELRRKLHPPIQQNPRNSKEDDVDLVKMEYTKRKLQDGYKQVEDAKKQRTIQIMELQDLPKQANRHQSRLQPNRNKLRQLRQKLMGKRG